MPPGAHLKNSTGLALCRACRVEVNVEALVCPHCGAPRPGRAVFTGEGYEWKSRGTWLGEPLVHVAFGLDAAGRPRTARGVVAIGQRAYGGVAIGIIAGGVLAIGVVAFGLVSFGVVAIACGVAGGVNAIAPLALGVSAIGFSAYGVAPIFWKAGR